MDLKSVVYEEEVFFVIKCIVSDMDGTLLNSEEEISRENKQAIELAQKNGVEVVIATGRSYIEARHALDEAELLCPVISLNGAVVWNKEGIIVSSNPIEINQFKEARKILDKSNLYYEIYTNKGTYSSNIEESMASLVDILATAMPELEPLYITEKVSERFKSNLVTVIDDYDRLYDDPQIEFYKMFVFSPNIPLLGATGGELKQETDLVISSSGRGNLEITSKESQKGIALAHFLAERNIAMSDTMALGDSFNDVSMFEKVGRPVAMGNAPSEIKKICGEVTLTNNENGVAEAILKALNEK